MQLQDRRGTSDALGERAGTMSATARHEAWLQLFAAAQNTHGEFCVETHRVHERLMPKLQPAHEVSDGFFDTTVLWYSAVFRGEADD
jgi:hypothetical protein